MRPVVRLFLWYFFPVFQSTGDGFSVYEVDLVDHRLGLDVMFYTGLRVFSVISGRVSGPFTGIY
jgi:hypothetical protein